MSTGVLIETVDFVLFEDDEQTANRVTGLLERKGYDVWVSRTEREVLQLCKEGCRCFILDLTVQRKLDGMELLEVLKQQCDDAFVAILTSRPEFQAQADRLHADAYVLKTEDLVEPIDEIFRKMCDSEADRDPNHQAFLRYMKNPDWVRLHEGKYVGFVYGDFAEASEERVALLKELQKYPDAVPKYYGKVEPEDPIDQVFTPLSSE